MKGRDSILLKHKLYLVLVFIVVIFLTTCTNKNEAYDNGM